MAAEKTGFKRPESVLVVIHTPDLQVLLIERAAHPGYWQSVTGSLEGAEAPLATARREVLEETGFDFPTTAFRDWHIANRFEILPLWRARYAPGVTHNLEHVYSLCVPTPLIPTLAADEHRDHRWLSWRDAALKCFSWTNRDAIALLALEPQSGT